MLQSFLLTIKRILILKSYRTAVPSTPVAKSTLKEILFHISPDFMEFMRFGSGFCFTYDICTTHWLWTSGTVQTSKQGTERDFKIFKTQITVRHKRLQSAVRSCMGKEIGLTQETGGEAKTAMVFTEDVLFWTVMPCSWTPLYSSRKGGKCGSSGQKFCAGLQCISRVLFPAQ